CTANIRKPPRNAARLSPTMAAKGAGGSVLALILPANGENNRAEQKKPPQLVPHFFRQKHLAIAYPMLTNSNNFSTAPILLTLPPVAAIISMYNFAHSGETGSAQTSGGESI
ncbi:MAG: hypothetical protein PUA74_04430, partial [Clostridiales bacterium]|nr:hypothetical protein [Clostridiales bacterium]